MKYLLWLPLLAAPVWARPARADVEIKAVDRLAALYIEMGEKPMADRLLSLYWQDPPRVRFVVSSAMRPFHDLAGVRNGTVASRNVLLIHQDIFMSIKTVPDSRFNLRPFDPDRSLLPYALSVAHELVHLDQYIPNEKPAYEDPAWQEVDRLIQGWLKRIEAELQAVRQQPPSPNQKKRLQGLLDQLRALRSQCGALRQDAKERQADGIVSAGLKFGFESAITQIDRLLGATAPKPASLPLSGWVSQRFQVYVPDDNPGLRKSMAEMDRRHSHKLSLQPGVAKVQFLWGGQAQPVSLQVSWATPASLRPGPTTLTLKPADTGSQVEGGFLECNPQLFGITASGQWQRLGPEDGRITYANSKQAVPESVYHLRIPDGAAYKELVLNFQVCSNLYRRGLHVYYRWRD